MEEYCGMKITEAQAETCRNHHHACDCREYRMQKMEMALKNIADLADYAAIGIDFTDTGFRLHDIVRRAKEALEA